jgi:hypothetical protein
MTLRGDTRRGTTKGAMQLLLRPFAVVVLAIVSTAMSASAQDALVLFKTRAKDGGVDLIVRGARPGDFIQLLTDVHPDPDPARALIKTSNADGGGIARFEFSASDVAGVGGDLFAQAFTSDLRSNVVPLRVVPALYLLVDDVDQRARVLRFDPTRGTLDPRLVRLDADSVLAIGGYLPVAARDGSLVKSGPDASGVAAANLKSGERPIDLVASADQSLLLALTREDLPLGRTVIRLRLIESSASHEIASLEVLRGGGRLVSAWLVSDSDSHRALVAERDGAIREVVLGAEPGCGLSILPLTPQTSEELLKVAIHGDQVVVVTQPGPIRSRRAATSRVLVFDLNERGAPVETILNSVARDLAVVERPGGGAAAFVALDSGQVEVVSLDPDGDHALFALPDVRLLAQGPDGSLYAMQGGDPAVVRIDPATLQVDRLPLLGLQKELPPRLFGVFGDVEGGTRRSWLYVVQPLAERPEEDELLCVELDPVDSHPISAIPPQQLGGRVRRALTR